DELVEEIRRALIQVGQKLSRHIRHEEKAADMEEKLRHIEMFGPILVSTLVRILKAPKSREKAATDGLAKLLGRDAKVAESELKDAVALLEAATAKAAAADKAAEAELKDTAEPEKAAEAAQKAAESAPKAAPIELPKKAKKSGGEAKAEKLAAASKKARQQSLFGAEDLPPPASAKVKEKKKVVAKRVARKGSR
ncbi:MAG TPA: hypothetical protein VMV18_08090, partial [bacterium]|nr:hypothetical protein [bacterium]